eukprot:scaffold160105_cov31-Prasinocladus_malaysianus.AAC.1
MHTCVSCFILNAILKGLAQLHGSEDVLWMFAPLGRFKREFHDLYEVRETLGNGTFGRVNVAIDRQTGERWGRHPSLSIPLPKNNFPQRTLCDE